MTTVVPGVPPLRPPGVATRPRVGRRARSRAATAWRVASNPAARLGGGARGALAGGVRLFADSRSRTTSSPPLASTSTSRGFPTARASPRRETRTRAIGTETRAETECADGDENCVPPPGAVPLDATATDGVDAVAAEARGTMTRKTNNVAFVDKLRVDDATTAAMKKRSEAYATLDDIVLDFDPSLDTAQKLLLIGGYFSSSPTEVATRLAEVTAVAARLYAVWTWEEKTNVPDGSRTRASTLRDGIAGLGPVFVKMAQARSDSRRSPYDGVGVVNAVP
ncbi:uncharacterized protein MICPUCDRAFT_53110 [Micromonas pusilla CCMP1545]|uniref:Predicted protein n=1 Tax=Micromonas pusilla (strain CCMP1545) TaxID=564608 RepID=C1N602_MICPC|nr:uncharacterized protein MICPUCDRAFT_53110 [Micromonas pusilla CCMP1545]EEH52589.1 predicted protein [Micromonas pusilla CCMP1545]|eukprot:XP_003063453.1 predicted protein [Micromonas pusilla CCMP1545]